VGRGGEWPWSRRHAGPTPTPISRERESQYQPQQQQPLQKQPQPSSGITPASEGYGPPPPPGGHQGRGGRRRQRVPPPPPARVSPLVGLRRAPLRGGALPQDCTTTLFRSGPSAQISQSSTWSASPRTMDCTEQVGSRVYILFQLRPGLCLSGCTTTLFLLDPSARALRLSTWSASPCTARCTECTEKVTVHLLLLRRSPKQLEIME